MALILQTIIPIVDCLLSVQSAA